MSEDRYTVLFITQDGEAKTLRTKTLSSAESKASRKARECYHIFIISDDMNEVYTAPAIGSIRTGIVRSYPRKEEDGSVKATCDRGVIRSCYKRPVIIPDGTDEDGNPKYKVECRPI